MKMYKARDRVAYGLGANMLVSCVFFYNNIGVFWCVSVLENSFCFVLPVKSMVQCRHILEHLSFLPTSMKVVETSHLLGSSCPLLLCATLRCLDFWSTNANVAGSMIHYASQSIA